MVFIFFVLILILTILDILINIKDIVRLKFYTYLITNDPFYFRVENIFFFISVVMLVVYAPINLVLLYASEVYYSIIDSILGEIFLISNSIYFFGFVTFLTLFNLCPKKPDSKEEFFKVVFKNKDLYDLFLKFSIKEWSSENVLIMSDIDQFHLISDFKEKLQFAKTIESNYLNHSLSPMEINVDHFSISSFKTKMKNLNENNIDLLFDEVETSVKLNMDDILMRFEYSHEYLKFEKDQKYFSQNVIL
jgi:hypothetical protein